jgi:uncharacterized membrane protein YhaH (DUF805 family)
MIFVFAALWGYFDTLINPSAVYILLTLIPYIAIAARRFRDTGKSPWWCVSLLIPFIGYIAAIGLCFFPSAVYNTK